MTKFQRCINPVVLKDSGEDLAFTGFLEPFRAEYINQVKPYEILFEMTNRCPGSCAYCYTSSTTLKKEDLPKEKLISLVDEAKALDIKVCGWFGGCCLVHPDLFELVSYSLDQGLRNWFLTSGIISKKHAKQIVALGSGLDYVGVHIDTINPELYNLLHTEPKTLDLKIQGHRNLLEAGFPPEKVMCCITLTNLSIQALEETVDFFVDTMGSKDINYVIFKAEGFAKEHLSWEPSLSEIKKAVEYRAQKLGDQWLRIGSSDAGKFFCRSNFAVKHDGSVVACPCIPELAYGNIYKENLTDIFERSRDELLFNFEVHGYCGNGECKNSDVCNGCRANAYHYLGDIQQSDPRCIYNPEAKEHYY